MAIAPSISRIVSPRWVLTDCRMRSPCCCRTSYRPRPSMSTHISGQTHLVRLRWPRPHDTHVYCQQVLSLVIHLSLPAKGAINRLLLAIHKRLGRGHQRCSRQGRKAAQAQLFQLVFAEESGLDLFQRRCSVARCVGKECRRADRPTTITTRAIMVSTRLTPVGEQRGRRRLMPVSILASWESALLRGALPTRCT